MSRSYRRYEFLLPRRYNDQRPIPDELFIQVLLELETQFGSVSSETQVIHGRWRHEGTTIRDELARIFVDVADSDDNRLFFEQFKERLKSRFEQIDIWMTTHLIEVV